MEDQDCKVVLTVENPEAHGFEIDVNMHINVNKQDLPFVLKAIENGKLQVKAKSIQETSSL